MAERLFTSQLSVETETVNNKQLQSVTREGSGQPNKVEPWGAQARCADSSKEADPQCQNSKTDYRQY